MMAGKLALCLSLGASIVNAQFSLTNTLPQGETNGGNLLGTLSAPALPLFINDTYIPEGSFPWGNRTVAGSHPQYDMPDTCVTRYYDFTLSRGTLSPDGVTQNMILINGQFPGPLLKANWGDWIEVNVRNEIYGPEEGTSLHYHGINQVGTPWMDGVPTVSQCPIPPGQSFTYRFRADNYGSSWYHAHFSAQYTAGVLGPMVIYGPTDGQDFDIDLGPVMLMEWYHDDYEQLVTDVMTPPTGSLTRPHADSNLIQGKGYYPCADVTDGAACGNAGLAEFQFTSGKKHKLRLINAGGELFTTFSIDNHTMTIVANDFVPVEPYEATYVTLGVGQRTDIIVEATGSPGEAYWMRSFNGICGDPRTNTFDEDGMAVIFYEGANTIVLPDSAAWATPNNTLCQNTPLALTTPIYQIPAADPDVIVTINMTTAENSTGTTLWYMNGVAYEGDYNSPVLLSALNGFEEFPIERNVFNLGSSNTVRLVFYNTNASGHPLHIHGHNFQVLAEGFGPWNGSVTNPSNPQRRDVQQNWGGASVVPGVDTAYTVFQWTQDNPGVWPFHCHIAWHLSAGMNILLGEKLEDVATMTPPQSVTDNCNAWGTYTNGIVVDQLDDGMRRRSKVERAMDDAMAQRKRESVIRRKTRPSRWV